MLPNDHIYNRILNSTYMSHFCRSKPIFGLKRSLKHCRDIWRVCEELVQSTTKKSNELKKSAFFFKYTNEWNK